MARNHQFGDFCGNDGLSLSLGIIGSLASNTITVYFNHILGQHCIPSNKRLPSNKRPPPRP